MAGGAVSGGSAASDTYAEARQWLLVPSWLVLGIFVLAPVCVMVIYSFLTKEFRGGVIWESTLAAYDQFLLTGACLATDRRRCNGRTSAYFGARSWQAGLATILSLLIGFPTAYYIATRPASTRTLWVFLITIPYWVNLLIRTVSMKFLMRDEGPLNDSLMTSD